MFVSCLLKRLVFDSLDLFFMTDDGAYLPWAVISYTRGPLKTEISLLGMESFNCHFGINGKQNTISRVEICRDRQDRRSCKIFANCVNVPGKQRNFLHNMRRSTRFTHTKCDFALKLSKFYTLRSNKKTTKITDINNKCIYAVFFN